MNSVVRIFSFERQSVHPQVVVQLHRNIPLSDSREQLQKSLRAGNKRVLQPV